MDIIDTLIEKNVNSTIIGFLKFDHGMAETQDVDTWCVIGKIMDKTPDITLKVLTAYVGEGLAIKILQYIEIRDKLPNPIDIINGDVTKIDNLSFSTQYSLVTNLCFTIDGLFSEPDPISVEELHEKVDNVIRFLMDNLNGEYVVLAVKLLFQQFKLPLNSANLKTFDEFYKRYSIN